MRAISVSTIPALSPLSIGNVTIGFPVVQAALSGYSDLPMRVIARQHGASYTVCEVMLDQFLLALSKRQKTKHYLDIHPSEHPVGGQLMGAEPEQFALGALKLASISSTSISVALLKRFWGDAEVDSTSHSQKLLLIFFGEPAISYRRRFPSQ